MTKLTTACSVCGVEFVFAGDEKSGDSLVCVSCGASFLIKDQTGDDSANWEVDEEF